MSRSFDRTCMWPGCGQLVGRGQKQPWICHAHVRPKRFWSLRDEAFLREYYADSLTKDLATVLGRDERRVFAKALAMGLKKAPDFVAQQLRANGHKLQAAGFSGRFKKGHLSWNKGMKNPIAQTDAMRATQFKQGAKPQTWVPIGSTTINSDGYLDRKVADGSGPRHLFWKPVHRLVWEAAHGPVPAGHIVRFKQGRKTTVEAEITLDAVECVSRAEHALTNGSLCSLPKELADVHRLRGALTKVINRRERQEA